MNNIDNNSCSVNPFTYGFEGYAQFITLNRNDKKPIFQSAGLIDPESRSPIGLPYTPDQLVVYDPKNWKTLSEIRRFMTYYPEIIPGFVFIDELNMFFIDLDGCFEPNGAQYTNQAKDIIMNFPECYMELSLSGRGLHIIGTRPAGFPDYAGFKTFYKSRPQSNLANDTIELYIAQRYVALTFDGAQGSVSTTGSNLKSVADQYCAINTAPELSLVVPWDTDAPKSEWSGPDDDNELIQRMLTFQSTDGAVVFGNKVSFKDLWELNEEKLGAAYPPQNSNDTFNRSLADQALAGILAFATGCYRSRMERIMRMSPLVREKWNRKDYIKHTVDNAVQHNTKVYNASYFEKKRMQMLPPLPDGNLPPGNLICFQETYDAVFTGIVYDTVDNIFYLPDHTRLNRTGFANNNRYSGYMYQIAAEGNIGRGQPKITGDCARAFTQNKLFKFPTVNGTVFSPEESPWEAIDDGGVRRFNTYHAPDIKAVEGDVSWYYDFLGKLCPDENDREIINAWMTALVKHPGRKFTWAIALQGGQGIGKDTLINIVKYMIGYEYVHDLRPELFEKEFNSWLYEKLLINVQEFDLRTSVRCYNKIKDYITSDKFGLERKGCDNRMVNNTANFIFTTNDKEAIARLWSERRIAPISLRSQTSNDRNVAGLTDAYFNELYSKISSVEKRPSPAIEALYYHFIHTTPNPKFDPCVVTTAPVTSFREEARELSRSPLAEQILEIVEQGVTPGFKGDMVFMGRINLHCSRHGKIVSGVKKAKALNEIDFKPHPLHGVRFSRRYTGIGQPRVYLRKNHPLFEEKNREKFQEICIKLQEFPELKT